MINAGLLAQIEDLYFGNTNTSYQTLLNNIISCTKVEQYNSLNIDFTSSKIMEIFANATRKPNNMMMTGAKSKDIYLKIKAVRSNSHFI